MGKGLKRAGQIAAGIHRGGEILSDTIDKQTGVNNDAYGEVAFAVMFSQIADALEPFLGNAPEPFRFDMLRYSSKHELYPHDYLQAGLWSGTIVEKKGRLFFKKELWSGEPAPQRVAMERAYTIPAHAIYEAGNASIDYKAFYSNDLSQQQAWKTRTETLGRFVGSSQDLPLIYTLPHVSKIMRQATQFMAHRALGPSPVKMAIDLYEHQIKDSDTLRTTEDVRSVSHRIARESIALSNNLLQWDPSVSQSGLDFRYLEDEPQSVARAVSQVLMVDVLKAIECRDMEAVAFMNNIAYCAWAMTQFDSEWYRDDDMSSSLAWQWGIVTQEDLQLDPYDLHVYPDYRDKAFQALIERQPGLQRLLY